MNLFNYIFDRAEPEPVETMYYPKYLYAGDTFVFTIDIKQSREFKSLAEFKDYVHTMLDTKYQITQE